MVAALSKGAPGQEPPAIYSVDSGGRQASGDSGSPALAGSRAVAFVSEAGDLVTGDTNQVPDVFHRDLALKATVRASVGGGIDPVQGNAPSDQPGLSASGRLVAFRSLAALVAEDRNRLADIYLRDLDRSTTELISIGLNAEPSDGDSSGPPSLDAKGGLVAFLSAARNLAAVPGNGRVQVYLRDRGAKRTDLVTLAGRGVPSGGDATSVALSGDGRMVAFTSLAEDLVEGDSNKLPDAFLHDRLTGETRLLSAGPGGRPANGLSEFAAISASGRLVAFASRASNLLPEDRDARWDVYLHDTVAGRLELVSRPAAGAGLDGDSLAPSIGGGGRLVAFQSSAQLTGDDRNGFLDAYVHDRALGETALLSSRPGGGAAEGDSELPRISEDGSLAVFQSTAPDIIPGDQNRRRDIVGVKAAPRRLDEVPLSGNLLFRVSPAEIRQLRPDGTATGLTIPLARQVPPAAFALDNRGVLWLVNTLGQVVRHDGSLLTRLDPVLEIRDPGAIRPPVVAADGLAWVAAPPRIHRIDAAGRVLEKSFGGAAGISLALDPFRNLWAGISEGDTHRLVELTRDLREARSFRIGERLDFLASDHSGNLLGFSSAAVVKYSAAGVRLYQVRAAAPRALVVDGGGNAVVLHREAATWIDPLGSALFSIENRPPIADGLAGGLVLDGLGRAWVSVESRTEVRRIDPIKRGAVDFTLGPNLSSADDLGGDRSGFMAASSIDPAGDADRDSIPNRVEVSNRLDPLDPKSPARRVLPVVLLSGRPLPQNQVELSWSNPMAYRIVHVLRDGRPVRGSPFPGGTLRIVDTAVGGGPHLYQVHATGEELGGGGQPAGGGPGGGGLGAGGAEGDSPVVSAVVVVGDGSQKACVDLLEQPYALVHVPTLGGRLIVSSPTAELPVFDLSLDPVDTVFPHPAPGGEIRGIEHDPAGGRLLFLLSDGRVFRTALDGSGASFLYTLAGGPPPSLTGYTGLAQKGGILYVLLGPGYDCLVGFQGGSGLYHSDSGLGSVLGVGVEQSIGLEVSGEGLLVGIGEDSSQSITDAFRLEFAGEALVDSNVNMPLGALATTLVTDIEYVAGQGLYVVDADNRRLCLLEADLAGSPVIESLIPAGGPEAGGTPVNLLVRNLRSREDTRIEVGGVERDITSYAAGPDPSRKVVTFTTPPHPAGGVRVEVITSDGRSFLDPGFTYGAPFVRGNLDALGAPDITDALNILGYLFLGDAEPPCLDAADVDDNGAINLGDPVSLLNYLFLGGPPPRAPFPAPGPDPTPEDPLSC